MNPCELSRFRQIQHGQQSGHWDQVLRNAASYRIPRHPTAARKRRGNPRTPLVIAISGTNALGLVSHSLGRKAGSWLMRLGRAVHVVGVVVVLSVSAACQKTDHPNSDLRPVSSEQQNAVVDATKRLRDLWNQRACEAIYEQAAVTFRSQPLPD